MPEEESPILSSRIPEKIKKVLEAAAKRRGETLSQYCRRIFEKKVESLGKPDEQR